MNGSDHVASYNTDNSTGWESPRSFSPEEIGIAVQHPGWGAPSRYIEAQISYCY